MRIEFNLDIQYEIYKPKDVKVLKSKTLPVTENTVSTRRCGWNHDHDSSWCTTSLGNFSHNNEQRM